MGILLHCVEQKILFRFIWNSFSLPTPFALIFFPRRCTVFSPHPLCCFIYTRSFANDYKFDTSTFSPILRPKTKWIKNYHTREQKMKFNTESILLKPVALFFPNGSHQLLFFEVVGEPVCAAHEYFVSFWRRIHNACQVKKNNNAIHSCQIV